MLELRTLHGAGLHEPFANEAFHLMEPVYPSLQLQAFPGRRFELRILQAAGAQRKCCTEGLLLDVAVMVSRA